jgi:hypothetical protein
MVDGLVTEVQVLKDVTRRQHTFIQELYELKSSAASKAELHAAVHVLRNQRDKLGLGTASC